LFMRHRRASYGRLKAEVFSIQFFSIQSRRQEMEAEENRVGGFAEEGDFYQVTKRDRIKSEVGALSTFDYATL